MKKVVKKIYVCIVIIAMMISLIPTGFVVKAEEGSVLNLDIPSNEMRTMELYTNYDYSDVLALNLLLNMAIVADSEGTFLVNDEGKKIIKVLGDLESDEIFPYFALLEGVTDDECTFEIDEESRQEIIAGFGTDIFRGYSFIHLNVTEMSGKEDTETAYVNLDNIQSTLEMDFVSYYLFQAIFSESAGIYTLSEDYYKYEDKNGKILMLQYPNAQNEEIQFILGDVSSDDDVILELDEEVVQYLNHEYHIDTTGYNRVIIKFGDTQYNDDDLVYDFTKLNENNSVQVYDIWNVMSEFGLVRIKTNSHKVLDDDENELFELNEYTDMYRTIELLQEYEYADNMVINYEDYPYIFDDFYEILGFEFDNIAVVFKNPTFTEGDGQEYDASEDDALSFRLNIDYDNFQSTGVVLIDGEEVDKEFYTATSGSTILTFDTDYVNSLENGDHTIRVNVIDGFATAQFKILNNEGEEQETTPEEETDSKVIPTGDNILFYFGSLLVSVSGIILLRKKKYNNI